MFILELWFLIIKVFYSDDNRGSVSMFWILVLDNYLQLEYRINELLIINRLENKIGTKNETPELQLQLAKKTYIANTLNTPGMRTSMLTVSFHEIWDTVV